MLRHPPRSTRTVTLFPYPTLFRSQDIGLALHPPMLYLGYVGFSTTFAFAVAALLEGRVDPAWARWVRPWALAAWTFLTAGIALGSGRSEEHTSELQSLMRISYAVFCLKKKNNKKTLNTNTNN